MRLIEAATFIGSLPSGLRAGEEQYFSNDIAWPLPEVGTQRLQGVVFTEAGELFGRGGVLEESFLSHRHYTRRNHARYERRRAAAMADPVQITGPHLWITDAHSHNYYHWLCDALPRLEAWLSRNASARLLLPRRVLSQPFVSASLAAYPEVELLAQPPGFSARVEELLLPDRAAPEARHRPELVERVRERLSGRFAADAGPPHRRIHVSRAGARFRRVANEAELVPVLNRHGFEIVRFEEMAFADQIRLAAETLVFCGPHGAGLANMVFTQPQCRVLELRQLAGTPNCFFALAQAIGRRYQTLACGPLQDDHHPHAADIVCEPASIDAALALITEGP